SFNDRVRRTIAGVFHHISPEHADLYFNEVGFRWSQRVRVGNALRRTRKGREIIKPLWSRIAPALQLPAVFRSAVGANCVGLRKAEFRSGALWLCLVMEWPAPFGALCDRLVGRPEEVGGGIHANCGFGDRPWKEQL